MSQEVGDTYESGGVPLAAKTAGEGDRRIVMDGLGVSKAPGEDEGQNGESVCAHSEVVVDSVTEVADVGEALLPQLVTSSTSEKVPPLNLATLQPASPPTIRLTSPPGSSHSSDKSVHEGTVHGVDLVSPPDASTKAQGHSSAGEIIIFTTSGEVPPISMTKLATDIEDLRTELRTRDAEMKTEMKSHFEDMLKTLTVSHANVDKRLQSVETQALTVNERITSVEKVGEATQRQPAVTQRQAAVTQRQEVTIEGTLVRVDNTSDEVRKEFERRVHILERDMTNRIDGDGAFQEAIHKKVAVVTDTHTVLNTSVQNCSKNLSTFKKEREDKDAAVK